MRKYRYMISLFVIIVAAFSLFYINNQLLSNTYAQFNIATVAGDEAVKERLIIRGDYHPSEMTFEEFKLTAEGTNYMRDEAFFNRRNDYNAPEKIATLQEENRSFMRAKSTEENMYVEQEDTLIYASIPYTRWGVSKGYLQIETYERTTDTVAQYEVELPELVDYATVKDVYINEEELYVVLFNRYEEERTMFQIVSYQLSEETVKDIYEIDVVDEGLTDVLVDDDEQPTEMLITEVTVDYEVTAEATEQAAHENSALQVEEEVTKLDTVTRIDLQTGEKTEIDVPQPAKTSLPIAFNGNDVIFLTIKGKDLVFHTYDLTNESLTEKFTIETNIDAMSVRDLDEQVRQHNNWYTLIDDVDENEAEIVAIDLNSISLLYQGRVEDTAKPTNLQDAHASFYILEVLED